MTLIVRVLFLQGARRDSIETVNKLQLVLGEIDVMSTGEKNLMFLFSPFGKPFNTLRISNCHLRKHHYSNEIDLYHAIPKQKSLPV